MLNVSTSNHNQELVTSYIDHVPTTKGSAKKHNLLCSLPRLDYGLSTDLEKTIATWAHQEVNQFKTNPETVSL